MVVSSVFFPVAVFGRDHIPRKGGFILASNHLSNLDPMILGLASGRRLNYVAKEALFRNKFFGFVLRQVGAFPIKRDSLDIRAIKEALRRLKKNGGTVIFPEGTRKSRNDKTEIQPGIGFLAVKSGVPVVPALIKGSERVLPPGVRFPRRGRITVRFGKATQYLEGNPYPEIASKIMHDISALAAD